MASVGIDGPHQVHAFREFGLGQENRRVRGTYNQRQIDSANEASKQPQREKILGHIIRSHKRQDIRLLSMPGLYWPFEKMLLNEWPWPERIRFTGLEWNWPTIERGMAFMPGRFDCFDEYKLSIGNIKIASTDTAKWIYTSAGDFLTLRRQEKGRFGANERFAKTFKGQTCAWLDMNTNFSQEAERCLVGLQSYIHIDVKRAPVAITMIVGQEHDRLADGSGGIERRLPFIVEMLSRGQFRTFEVGDAWQYTSENGCHLLNIIGWLVRRKISKPEGVSICELSPSGSG